MRVEEIKNRVAYKAISALKGIDDKLREYSEPIGGISDEQRQIVIDSLEREKEVWKFILNSAS